MAQLKYIVRYKLGLTATKDIKKAMSVVSPDLDMRCWDSWNDLANILEKGVPLPVRLEIAKIKTPSKSVDEQRAADYAAIKARQDLRNHNQYRMVS